jgi:hypothetical protein
MRSLGNEAGSEFEVEWDDGRLVGFSDVKTLFVAVKERA